MKRLLIMLVVGVASSAALGQSPTETCNALFGCTPQNWCSFYDGHEGSHGTSQICYTSTGCTLTTAHCGPHNSPPPSIPTQSCSRDGHTIQYGECVYMWACICVMGECNQFMMKLKPEPKSQIKSQIKSNRKLVSLL